MIIPDYTITVDDPKDADMSVVLNCVPYETEIEITLKYASDESSTYGVDVVKWNENLKQGANTINPSIDIDKFGIYWYEILDPRNLKADPSIPNFLSSAKLKIEPNGVYTAEYNETYN